MRTPIDITTLVDGVLADARASSNRRTSEISAIKHAELAPRTPLARGLRSLADALRADRDIVSYDDLEGLR